MKLFKGPIKFCFMLFLALGCARPDDSEGPRAYQLPWPDAQGNYSLQNISVDTLDRPNQLRGQIAQVYVQPAADSKGLIGERAVGRFISSDGIWTPADFITLQAVTIYAHLERLFKIDQALGFKWKHTPRSVGVMAIVDTGSGAMSNNAFFDGRIDAMVVVPYTDRDLPLSVNAGVIAHEHFHSIFYQLVMERLFRSSLSAATIHEVSFLRPGRCAEGNTITNKRLAYMQIILRGLNEGLADFWAWIYTGDVNFIAKSLSKIGDDRRLDGEFTGIPSTSELEDLIGARSCESNVLPMAYELGTQYARFLYGLSIKNLASTNSLSDRMEMAKTLMITLPMLANSFVNAVASIEDSDRELLSPMFMIKPIVIRLPSLTASSCKYIKESLKTSSEVIEKCEPEP